MLRISDVSENGTLRLRLDGQLSGPWVRELAGACAEALSRRSHGKPRLVLDFGGVSFLDADGIALVRELTLQGVRIANGSAFVTEQLKGVADVQR
jgi:hypothetical protein